MEPDVVVVGAGPVGLFTAIETKLLNPALHIKILERNKHYNRHHILRIDDKSLSNSITYAQYENVKELHGFVPTSEIENTFKTIAEQLGIEIERDTHIEDANTLFTEYPFAHTIIGADGAHSKIRQQLFDDKKIIDTNLQYIVEVKYQVVGETKPLKNSTYGLALGQVPFLVSENVGKEKKGRTPVSLFIFVDEKTYNTVRRKPNAHISDLNPSDPVMVPLLNTIKPWLSLRRAGRSEVLVENSEKINGVALNIYQAETFAKKINGKNVYLVGDAAAAVPYFRALNAGLLCAQTTAKSIARSEQADLNELNEQLALLFSEEIKRAYKRNKTVNKGRGLNTFLTTASKLTTGSFLTEEEQAAMLNARVNRPNIFRRHPRVTLSAILFSLISVIAIPLLVPLFPTLAPALAIGFGAAFGFFLLFLLILKVVDRVKHYLNPIHVTPALEWETNEEFEDSPRKMNTLLKGKKQVGNVVDADDTLSGCVSLAPSAISTESIFAAEPVFPAKAGIHLQI